MRDFALRNSSGAGEPAAKTYGLFFVYVDYFLDSRRPFYVGKGSDVRLKTLKRNELHTRLTQGREWYRVAVDRTTNEREALDLEIALIRYLETRDHQGGANLRDGGGGSKAVEPLDVGAERGARRLYDDALRRLHHAITVSEDRTNDAGILDVIHDAIRLERRLRNAETAILRRQLEAARAGES